MQKPGSSNILYLLTLNISDHPTPFGPYKYVGRELLLNTIDMDANNGAGSVTHKNEILLQGVLNAAAATRHANGRDWWIVVSHADSNLHYRILLTPEDFSKPEVQAIGTKPNPLGIFKNELIGNTFSLSGKLYVDYNSWLGFSVYDFDRCTGLLSHERRGTMPPAIYTTLNGVQYFPWDSGTGLVFSPNDSLLYLTVSVIRSTNPAVPLGSRPMLL